MWALDSGEYAVRENPSSVKLFKNFKETHAFKPPFSADAIYGGALLGVRSGEVRALPATHRCGRPLLRPPPAPRP